MARFLYRLSTAGLLGAQVFFAAVAAQVVFHGGLERHLAGDLVGAMLAQLDSATLALSAIAGLCAVLLGSGKRALLPIVAGLLAAVSAFAITPAIHALRLAGQTASPDFGRLHGFSFGLLLAQMILMLLAVWFEPPFADRPKGG